MADKRKFIRVKEHHLLKYKVLGKEKELSFARNISAGGVMFHGKVELAEGTVIDMFINFPDSAKIIDVVAKVVWCLPLAKLDGFDVGVEFISIDDTDREFIAQKMKEAPEEDRL